MGNNNVKNNEIIAEINIKEDDINKEIRIMNSYEEYKRRNRDIAFLEYKNEKEIKKCIIEINNKRINFSYFHKFNKIGKYIIKYSFLKEIININHMFSECEHLTNIDLSNFNTQNVINMSFMFSECNSLTNIDLSNFNTKKVTNMNFMFYECNSLTNIDLSNFNTQKVTNMSYMFYGCKSLTNIGLSNFNTQNFFEMNHMFFGCNSLLKSFLFH